METCLLNKRSRSSIKKINWWGNSWWTSFFRDKQVCGYEIVSCLYRAGHTDETILSSWLCYQVSKNVQHTLNIKDILEEGSQISK